jgi:hypothetical protein
MLCVPVPFFFVSSSFTLFFVHSLGLLKPQHHHHYYGVASFHVLAHPPGLNTTCTTLDCILESTFAAGYQNLTEVIVIPEQDAWTYSDGKSMVCDSFVVEVWKAGGVFGDLEIQGTEFTPTDLYTMGVFDSESPRPAECPSSPQDLPNLCQVMGRHVARFPHWNTITPYSHMAEHCPSMPPNYERTPGC